jgi:hypothetical protein
LLLFNSPSLLLTYSFLLKISRSFRSSRSVLRPPSIIHCTVHCLTRPRTCSCTNTYHPYRLLSFSPDLAERIHYSSRLRFARSCPSCVYPSCIVLTRGNASSLLDKLLFRDISYILTPPHTFTFCTSHKHIFSYLQHQLAKA